MYDKDLGLTLKPKFSLHEPPAPTHQGWSNMATYLYNLYFFQEEENYKKFCKLAKPIDELEVYELFRSANIWLDNDLDDRVVYIKEIVDNFHD